MSNINYADVIMYMYPNAVPLVDFVVRNDADGRGQYIDDWNLADPKPTDEDIQANYLGCIKKQRKNEINDKCTNYILSGFTATNGHFYWFNEKDQANFTEQMCLLLNDSTITSIQWKTGDGIITHTRDEFMQVISDGNTFKRNAMTKYWTLCAEIDASKTEEEVNSYQW